MMVARFVSIPVTYITEPKAGECPTCGFDALRRVRAYLMNEHGVTTIADRTYCGRCVAEERRARGAR